MSRETSNPDTKPTTVTEDWPVEEFLQTLVAIAEHLSKKLSKHLYLKHSSLQEAERPTCLSAESLLLQLMKLKQNIAERGQVSHCKYTVPWIKTKTESCFFCGASTTQSGVCKLPDGEERRQAVCTDCDRLFEQIDESPKKFADDLMADCCCEKMKSNRNIMCPLCHLLLLTARAQRDVHTSGEWQATIR